jgi:hypothetical protein
MTLDRWPHGTGRVKAISDQLCGMPFGLLMAATPCPFHVWDRQVNNRSESLLIRPMDIGLAPSAEEIVIGAVKPGPDNDAVTRHDTPYICSLR